MKNFEETEWEKVRQTFQEIWRYEEFRYPQAEIIRTLLAAQDALIIMPTGRGKSICFQLPALFHQGLTLVISPLVALMENQVKQLQKRHLPAALLHHELPRQERKQVLKTLQQRQLKLLYLSPETLLSTPVWQQLTRPDLQINALILDEAHCLAQWGETFRPTYRRLGTVRAALLQSKPPSSPIAIAAFTATADSLTQKTLREVLQLQSPQVFCLNPYRQNLHLRVQIALTSRCRRHQLLKFLATKGRQSGLIYVRSRRSSEEIAQWLGQLNYQTAAYHAGLSSQERRLIETDWLENKRQFVVCTSAFGMGIDKPDVRWIVHFQAPLLLSEYLQEVGRGGRDGQRTDALLLMSEPTGWLDPTDEKLQQFFLSQLRQQYQLAEKTISQLPRQGNITKIMTAIPGAEIALSLLHSADKLAWLDPFHYQIKSGNIRQAFLQLWQQQKQLNFPMQQYLRTSQCRWQFLLNKFGFAKEFESFQCGHCDNCMARSSR